ncbi:MULTISPECIES: hypothetical protein [Anaerotignum]|jgi:hypothetical protein|uniref:DUF4366 domain-containing protein n=1 Tax=Anaerotignum propionicum DSM 1682 TaxID=991789 RepID=A0A0X8VE39_ANAPI|nr:MULTISPECIES: hypothetical protein [Anaerotignum]HBF66583.1 hypothetical protein [Clostridium sp.]AMJ42055.1 hypothetical protein CPRO_25070 [Anaerotignum propionicum DSM 1682]MCQ4936939.1 hypothetical protein [Anaerotignum propionicum]MEA5057023.1 hypothetical protein [Anaerotignum propionicum]SHE50425.1 hypothetical protein SAMN02745151_00876 [[Clostridium] propionicum DSM 1682] [Anaerotignum propionicum DSM 1682]
MKKYFELKPSFEDLKDKIVVLHKEDDEKKTLFIVLAVLAAVLAVVALGVVYLLKTKMDDEYDEDWDYDWDDLEDEYCNEDDCCCTDKDVDDSVKVEKV